MLYIPNMKALGLVVSDKKIFENCILKTYFLSLWPTYATNWNGLNNFDRGPPRDHSCEVWSKSNKQFQRRCCLKKLLTDARTDGRWTTDDGPSQKLTLSTLCSGELKNKSCICICNASSTCRNLTSISGVDIGHCCNGVGGLPAPVTSTHEYFSHLSTSMPSISQWESVQMGF